MFFVSALFRPFFAFKVHVAVTSQWKSFERRQILRDWFSSCNAVHEALFYRQNFNVSYDYKFYLGNFEIYKETGNFEVFQNATKELENSKDIFVIEKAPDFDPKIQRDKTYVLDRPTSRAFKIAHLTKFAHENLDFDFLFYLDDDSFLNLPRLSGFLAAVVEEGGDLGRLLVGNLLQTNLDNRLNPVNMCPQCVQDTQFKEMCGELGVGDDLKYCAFQFSICQIYQYDKDEEILEMFEAAGGNGKKFGPVFFCMKKNLEEENSILNYFGTKTTPIWPLGMGFLVGREIAEFISINLKFLKMRGSADIQFGFWISAMENVNHKIPLNGDRDLFHDYPRGHSIFTKGCFGDSILVHRLKPQNWHDEYDPQTCELKCPQSAKEIESL